MFDVKENVHISVSDLHLLMNYMIQIKGNSNVRYSIVALQSLILRSKDQDITSENAQV